MRTASPRRLPLPLQSKLLSAIEAKRVRRLGAVAERHLDVKLIAATAQELSRQVTAGRFRADLYHRLAVVILELPPLRTRGADILLLAQHVLRQWAEDHGLPPKRLSADAEAWLRRYRWPGNVRELRHLLERVMLLHAAPLVTAAVLERLCLPQPLPASRLGPSAGHGDGEPQDEAAWDPAGAHADGG